ncbi:MAG TPA: hypothetical protein VFU15_17440 [Bacteroidia bacterium]|nr:hypothetical protein [Bacteroidia bacterium]
MKNFRVILFFSCALIAVSCGKRRKVIGGGTLYFPQTGKETWLLYLENDSCYEAFYSGNTLVRIISAKTKEEMEDSTYLERCYFPDGKLLLTKQFIHRVPEGEWTTYYDTGKQKSWKVIRHGVPLHYKDWFEDGRLSVEGIRDPNGNLDRKQYYYNGNMDQEFTTDSLGNGHCKAYHKNGKIETEGQLNYFSPFGLWKRWDSLGNPRTDTVYGIPGNR